MKRIKLAKSERGLYTIFKVLLGLAIFLAILGYNEKIVISFLCSAVAILIIYQINIFLNNRSHKKTQVDLSSCNDILQSEGYESKYTSNSDTYLIFNPNDTKVFDAQNILSIVVKDENNIVAMLDKNLHIPYEVETIGISLEEIEIRPTRIKITFDSQPQGLTVIKISPK